MGLERYRQRRDFAQTNEPRGRARDKRARGRRFVVQMHDARRLHYDLRLEADGVLKSWAVPKGPSLDPADKRLAVATEDHPLDYGDFEGVIPAGEYGAGPVLLWDRGTWTPAGDASEGLRKGHLKFQLAGEKLHGNWALIRRGDEGKWLLIKERDEAAADDTDLVGEQPRSVKSGRRIDELDTAAPEGVAPQPGELDNARRAAMPRSLKPELATTVDEVAAGDEWLHEVKYDGYRLIAYVRDGRARVLSRNDKDWTARVPAVTDAIQGLGSDTAILDGELVALRADGSSDFQALQNALGEGDAERLVYYAFDLPYLDGYDLRHAPLHQRKRLLRAVVERGAASSGQHTVRYADHAQGQGAELFKAACARRLEGLISKRADSPYRSRRSRDWRKAKCGRRQEFVIGGFTDPAGSRIGFGALLLGYHEGQQFRYAGRVGTGFPESLLRDLTERLRALEQDRCAFDQTPPAQDRRVHWVRPELVAEIRFAEWTGDGHLRQPSFLGLREDKAVTEVSRERAESTTDRHRAAGGRNHGQARGQGRDIGHDREQAKSLHGVRLSHPERVLYPEQGITKARLAEYYAGVADHILPHVADRPLSLVRCPRGPQQCFYQKHLQEGAPEVLGMVEIQEKAKSTGNGRVPYAVVRDAAGLIALAQLGVLEIHPWGARADRPERPDRLIFDLDPGEGVAFPAVIATARDLRARLDELGLAGFPKTTGGKGLHVVVPLQRRHDWDTVKGFAGAIARAMATEAPDQYVATMRKDRRRGRVFIDYLRNARGATAIAPYSTRTHPEAPIAMPLRWEDLGRLRDPRAFTLENTPARLRRRKHQPWGNFFDLRQSITRAARRRLGLD